MKGERVIVAIDSFKGSLTSRQANQAAREALLEYGWSEAEIECIEVSDGGEGFLDAVSACVPVTVCPVQVHGPLMQPVTAPFLMTSDGTAYIESASVCGYTQVPPELRHPGNTTSFGLGELIRTALRSGTRHLVIGLGGTCTCDAGLGMIQGLGGEIRIAGGNGLTPGTPMFLAPVTGISFPERSASFSGVPNLAHLLNGEIPVEVWSDTEAVFCGPNGAVMVFGPQKGIAPQELEIADRWFGDVAEMLCRNMNLRQWDTDSDHRQACFINTPGTGAAGGLGMVLSAVLGGRILQGGEELLRLARFGERLGLGLSVKPVGLVITGEGRFDSQTLLGKIPARIARAVRDSHLFSSVKSSDGAAHATESPKVFCLCGRAEVSSDSLFDHIIQITPPAGLWSDSSNVSSATPSLSYSPVPVSGATTDIPSANDLRPDIAAANLRRALLQTLSQGIG